MAESRGNTIDYRTPKSRKPRKITDKDCRTGLAKLNRILQKTPDAKGLAIIIGIPDVDGTDDDVRNVTTAFEQLGFAVWCEDVPTLEAIRQMVESAAKYESYSASCRCIVFYFAGHGGSHDGHAFVKPYSLPYETDTKLFIKEGIVDPFSPQQAPRLGKDIYRIFFFDCCLSDPTRAAPGRRPPGNLPAGANTLVAYATSMDYKAKGQVGKGGIWTNILCKNLKQDLPISLILDITCDEVVKRSIIEQGNQAPHYTSSVGIFCLKSQKSTWKDFKKALIAGKDVSQKKAAMHRQGSSTGGDQLKRAKMSKLVKPAVQKTIQPDKHHRRNPKSQEAQSCPPELVDSPFPAGSTIKGRARPSSVAHGNESIPPPKKKKTMPTCTSCGIPGHTRRSKACRNN